MPNIANYNINDVSLYYQAISLLTRSPMEPQRAAEEVRKRLVAYLERRRSVLSLPPLRGDMPSLGTKILQELRQMGLAEKRDGRIAVTAAGAEIESQFAGGRGRAARRLVLVRLIDTFDNLANFLHRMTPPAGKPFFLPVLRLLSQDDVKDPEEQPEDVEGLEVETVCQAWADFCTERGRGDLLPENVVERATDLMEKSRDRRRSTARLGNALQQLVIETGTGGNISQQTIYRTIRDRLISAGAVNSMMEALPGKPLAIEVVYSCLYSGMPASLRGWVPLDVNRPGLFPEELYAHEPAPEELAEELFAMLRQQAEQLQARAGYFRIYELRDRVCAALQISQGVFNAAFIHLYKTRAEEMTLGVDYETVTARRLPIEIKDGGRSDYFNLVAFRSAR